VGSIKNRRRGTTNRLPRRIVYLELLDSLFDRDGGSSRVLARIGRDFPWVMDEVWEIERWGLRNTRRESAPAHQSVRLRGFAFAFRVFPRVLLPVLVWIVQFVFAVRHPRTGIILAYSPLMAAGVAAARILRPTSILVVRVIESVSSRARILYRRPIEARLLSAIERFGLRRADLVLPVGEFTHQIARAAGVPEDRIIDLPNAISWAGADVSPTDAREGPTRLVSAGRFVPEKAFDVLILAFGQVFDEVPDVVLEIAGDGPERPSLQGLSKRLGIDARVRFPGWLRANQMPGFLSGAPVAVLPSRVEEGFPRLLIEAGLAGCALVGTDLGGIRDIVEPGRTGILVPVNDHEALAEALLLLLRYPDQARRLGTEARDHSRDYLARRDVALEAVKARLAWLRSDGDFTVVDGSQ
jgi:glycosyltransferase involved in cell wall biosynthesis